MTKGKITVALVVVMSIIGLSLLLGQIEAIVGFAAALCLSLAAIANYDMWGAAAVILDETWFTTNTNK